MIPLKHLSKKEEEELAHDLFLKELTRSKDGRYRVGLPWTCINPNIPSNRNEAERKKEVSKKELEEVGGHYLCHHPVIKPESATTSIRPVFDASYKVGRAPSLNDCLFKGPNLIEEIPAILLRFREKAIAVVSDISRAFLQTEVKEEDRRFLRFLWWEKKNKIKVYQHNRVLFGATCSPFLLSAIIGYHLNKYPKQLKTVTDKLLKSFYIDNCVTSVDNASELEEFISKSTEIMAEAKMDLRLWQLVRAGRREIRKVVN
ncbi:uncharacterized protein LOC118198203 [Stegodyphus dumicola]|uniref:uncharacterized protein LOC118198203 n=1 Tax=Stegodyphus dumicola TaxID=202533 RepID=UPI0015B2F269|nr:uncharacterized protein LOC118198203 [Stegodyphus dumicola]